MTNAPGKGGVVGVDLGRDSTDIVSPPRNFATTNRFVSWWEVHSDIAPFLAEVREWPMAGTPAWCALAADDPRRLAALLDAAQHWILRVETCQQAGCEASRAVSAAADWQAIARNMVQRRKAVADGAYIPRVAS